VLKVGNGEKEREVRLTLNKRENSKRKINYIQKRNEKTRPLPPPPL
jgi:hypothetical protein